jgi:hypothetical protein
MVNPIQKLIHRIKHGNGPTSSDTFRFLTAGSGPNNDREIEIKPAAYDYCLGASWDVGNDTCWMQKQFKYFNQQSRMAYMWANQSNNYKFQGLIDKARAAMEYARDFQTSCYKASKAFEQNIVRAFYDQTCRLVTPRQAAISFDLVTTFGLTTIVENFMLFNTLRYDTMEAGTGSGTPFGGDLGLQTPVTSTSIIQEGFALPYGVEARHGAPFLASIVDNDIKEIGIKDSVSTKLYSRSVFPSGSTIDHIQAFDTFSILHITLLKAV